MITRERDSGRTLPALIDTNNLGLSFSFRLANTNGVPDNNTSWTYYELPATAVLNRSRQASLDNMSQQVSITVLEDALPDYYAVLNYLVLEIDVVDNQGFRWPYHTGPIDSISENHDLLNGSYKKTVDISSFGVLQFTKDAYYLAQYWSPATSTFGAIGTPAALTAYSTVKHFSYTGTGRAIGTVQVVGGAWNTVNCLTTGTFPGFVVSTNSDFSAPLVRGVNYEITDSAGVAVLTSTSKGSLLFIKWLTVEPSAAIYIKFWTLQYFAVARTNSSTFPDSIRLPDYSLSYQSSFEPALKRNLYDDFVTTIAAGATTLVVTPVDNAAYRLLLAANPAGSATEYLEWQKANTGATEVRAISSVSSVTGAVTVSVAFSAAPAAGDFMRVVTTRPFPAFERFNNNQSTGSQSRPSFYHDSAGATAYDVGAFTIKPDQGIIVPNQGYHFQSGIKNVYVSDLIVINQSEGAIGADNRVESMIYSALTGYVATSKILTGNISDGANYYGNHTRMNTYVQNVDASGETRQQFIQRIADNGFPPNGKLFDRADGTVLVAALKQLTSPQYVISNVISAKKKAIAEPSTSVTVISKFPEARRLNRGQFNADIDSTFTNPQYMFDGVDQPDPTNTGTDFAFASNTGFGLVEIVIPDFGPGIQDPLEKIVIKGITGTVSASLRVSAVAGGAIRWQNHFWGGQFKLFSQSESVEIDAREFQQAYQAMKAQNGWQNTYFASIRLRFDPTSLITGFTMNPRITEIELWSKYNASWTSMLTDDLIATNDTSTYPTGWDSASAITNTGYLWWNRQNTIPMSFKYMTPENLKRIQPLYNANWENNRPRMLMVNQTRISQTDCKNLAERYLDETVIKTAMYQVDAIMDPRVDLGDTINVTLPDGSCLDLFVWSISDSGSPDNQICSYELVDYSGVA
jgi:hypothetical protein